MPNTNNVFAFPLPERSAAYNYAAVDPSLAGEMKAAAVAIRALSGEIDDRSVRIGAELITIKSKLPHGEWLPWIKAEFSWSARHAQYAMAAARGVGRNTRPQTNTRHFWITPPQTMAELNRRFNIDFDACPYPRPEGFNSLTMEWGLRNYVNLPFDNPYPFVKKAVEEFKKGKMSVVVLPITAARAIQLLRAAGATQYGEIDPVDWLAIEDGTINPAPPESRLPCVWLVLRPHAAGVSQLDNKGLFGQAGGLAVGNATSVAQDATPAVGPVIALFEPIVVEELPPEIGMSDGKKRLGRELVEKAFYPSNTVGDTIAFVRAYHRTVGAWMPSDLHIGSYDDELNNMRERMNQARDNIFHTTSENFELGKRVRELETKLIDQTRNHNTRVRELEAEIAKLKSRRKQPLRV